ncbi:MAG: DsbA family protein [Bacteroidetes bacterium]|nr:MAG: DsbA family protein [Bacteroidota bacterium]
MAKLNGTAIPEKEKPEIIYVFDSLCGWCYGFSPVITRIKSEMKSNADFLVLSGGMVREASPIGEIAGYIKNAYKVVEDTTGVKFGEKFLNDILEKGDAVFTSVPPAKALAVLRIHKPGECVEIAARLQKAILHDGINVDDYVAYSEIGKEFGMEPDDFLSQVKSAEIEEIVQNEFKMVAGLGVNGYPSVLLRKGKETHVLSRGYKDFDSMFEIVKGYISF